MGCGGSKSSDRQSVPVDNNAEMKIVVLGVGGVGKSALTFRFIQNKFMENYNPTIEDNYRKQCSVDGKNVVLDILDTAGQEEYTELREVYMRGGEGFIIVYSITDTKSFQEANEFRSKILQVKESNKVPIIFVGNKSDLEDKRQVSKAEGENLAKSHSIPFFETSAALGVGCDEIFIAMAKEIRKSRQAGSP